MQNNVIKLESVKKSESLFIELTGKRAQEVSKYWKAEVLEFKNKTTDEENYAVRLTSNLKGQTALYLKEYLEDNTNFKRIEKRLGKIGTIRTSYIKTIIDSVNEALWEQKEKIVLVDDIKRLLPIDSLSGASPQSYYSKLVKFIEQNKQLFPKKSSNNYRHNFSGGAILDNYPKNKHGNYPVAIRTGVLQELFDIGNDNKYQEVVESLVAMGAVHGKGRFKNFDNIEVSSNSYGGVEINSATSQKGPGFVKKIVLNNESKEVSVYIVNINVEKEG